VPNARNTISVAWRSGMRWKASRRANAKSFWPGTHLADEPATLEALASKYRVSRERVRQIELRALQKRKASVTARLPSGLPPAR
jgi:Sigma-70, region 4